MKYLYPTYEELHVMCADPKVEAQMMALTGRADYVEQLDKLTREWRAARARKAA